MARKMKRTRGRRARVAFGGLVNSFVRTISNTTYIILTIGFLIGFEKRTELTAALVKILTKLHMTVIAAWVKSNPIKAVGIMYSATTAIAVVPSAIAMSTAILISAVVYALPAPETATQVEYIGLVLLSVWAARTRSIKIRASILALSISLYAYGLWGTTLLA
uniref:Uncharacterized protein n=1 Tax=Xiangshan tombus-like virus TaxID=2886240 RepID=A0A8K1YQQ9_9TOMB|nr:MAG: hypothetical protein [Xiangshan tombus-like virus]